MTHIEQHKLEALILDLESFTTEESARINAHLSQCSLCAEQWWKLKEFYRMVDENIQQQPTRRDEEFAESLLATKRKALPERGLEPRRQEESLRETLESYAEVIEPYRRSFVQKFVNYGRIYPVRTAGATAFAVAAVVLSLLLARTPKDTDPTFAAVKNAVLTVQNKEGEVLWTESAVGIPDVRSDELIDWNRGKRYLSVVDIDGDGKREILLSGTATGGEFAGDTLYCFETNNRLRWKAGVGTMISFGRRGLVQHSATLIVDWIVVKRRADETGRLFVVSEDRNFSPMKLFEVDTKTGVEQQSFFNRGHCPLLLTGDVEGDGTNELLLGGENDGYNQACLAILDPSDINGFAPVPQEYLPVDSVRSAQEKYYILFPKTDLGELVRRAPFNQVNQIVLAATGNLIIHVYESTGNPKSEEAGSVLYGFDQRMKLKLVTLGDNFKVVYQRFYSEGKLKRPLTPAYTEKLKNSVLYWDGERSRFVSYEELTKPKKSGMP
jgi:hypothetical protein